MEGSGVSSSEERGAERNMDGYLKSIGLVRKKIAKDGSCLFRAVAEQVLHCQSLHTEVRARCVDFLQQNRDVYEAFVEGDFQDYLEKLRDPQQWVGEVEINALAVMYKRDFLIFQEPGKPAVNITDKNFVDQVQLCFLNGNHYDSVYPISRIKNAAVCQSILYELLYEGVFQVERSFMGVCQRAARPSDLLSDDGMPACHSSDESDTDDSEPLRAENGTSSSTPGRHPHHSSRGRGRGRQLPERVRRSLNPTLFRNVDYDIWNKTKRAQQKMDYCIAAGMQFTVRDRCQVRLDNSGRSYKATVKEVSASGGPVTVHIEELGIKQVPLWSLRPPSTESTWSTVASRDRKLSNGHTEWGKGRGKSTLAPPSVSQVTAAASGGSGGRPQKQHARPVQGTAEEPGKTSRKSLSAVEATFGLTEEQRLAREEEERNVALVEIQLRDELSFPALAKQPGLQADGGRRRGGGGADRRPPPPRSDTESPVEDGSAPTSSAPTSATSPSSPPQPPAADSSLSTMPSVTTVTALASGSSPIMAAPTAQSYAAVTAPPSSPAVFSFLGPVLPATASPSPPSSSPSSSSSPTFIAPIAPSPTGFPRHSPSPPSSSSSSLVRPLVPVQEAEAQNKSLIPKRDPQTPQSAPRSGSPLVTFIQNQIQVSAPPVKIQAAPPKGQTQTQTQTQSPAPAPQQQDFQMVLVRSPGPSGAQHSSLTQQNQETLCAGSQGPIQTSVPAPYNPDLTPPRPQVQSQVPAPPNQKVTYSGSQIHDPPLQHQDLQNQDLQHQDLQNQDLQHQDLQNQDLQHQDLQHQELQPVRVQVHTPHIQNQSPAPEPDQPASTQLPHPLQAPHHTHPSQVPHPTHSPHPSQVPHPSPSLSGSTIQNRGEAPPPPSSFQPSPPPLPQPIPGAVPLQQLSQLYQDLLYPGFPLTDMGGMAPPPPYSSNKSGEDLPRDVNILRFFFNLGVKAYSVPMCAPYIYLLPLQQAHFMHSMPSSRSPSPHCPPSGTQGQHPSTPPRYDHPAPPAEPCFTQPPSHGVPCSSLPWQLMPPARNPVYPFGYPPHSSFSMPYPIPTPSSQGYHPGRAPGHPPYQAAARPPSLGYQPPAPQEDLQGPMEQMQPAMGDRGLVRVPGPAEVHSAAANANANSNARPVMVPANFAGGDVADGAGGAMLLLDPPLTHRPMVSLVPDSSPTDGSSRFSPSMYRDSRPLVAPPPLYVQQLQSVGCSTEDCWEDPDGFRPNQNQNQNHRGTRRGYRGGAWRGRGGSRRRHGGEVGAGLNYIQFNPSHRGWSR